MAKRLNNRYFYLIDIDSTITVEYGKNKKDVLSWLDEFIDNLPYDWFYSDDTFQILYKDGTTDYIDIGYDGHKIRRQHIESIVYSNDCTYIVYGNIEMNECGVVYPAFLETIADYNILEVDNPYYHM